MQKCKEKEYFFQLFGEGGGSEREKPPFFKASLKREVFILKKMGISICGSKLGKKNLAFLHDSEHVLILIFLSGKKISNMKASPPSGKISTFFY